MKKILLSLLLIGATLSPSIAVETTERKTHACLTVEAIVDEANPDRFYLAAYVDMVYEPTPGRVFNYFWAPAHNGYFGAMFEDGCMQHQSAVGPILSLDVVERDIDAYNKANGTDYALVRVPDIGPTSH